MPIVRRARLTAAGLLLAAGLGSVASSPAVAGPRAHHTICVAVVVDARSVGGNVSTGCAKVPAGASGVDVLEAAGHEVTFRNDGLLCTIDGVPSTGCSAVDDTHYWAYFHRSPGSSSWSYSNEGPSTYQPVNDSTEGWVYDDGRKLTPKAVPYDAICPPESAPSARATHRASPGILPSHRPHPLSSPQSTPTALPPKNAAHPAPGRRHHPVTATPTKSLSGSPSVRPTPLSTRTAARGGGAGGLASGIIAAVIVAAIGSGTYLTNRRRRSR